MITNLLSKLDQKILSPLKDEGIQIIYYIVSIMVKISFINMIIITSVNLTLRILPRLFNMFENPEIQLVYILKHIVFVIGTVLTYVILRLFERYLLHKPVKTLEKNTVNFLVGCYFILSETGRLFGLFGLLGNLMFKLNQPEGSIVYSSFGLSTILHLLPIVYVIIAFKLIKSSGFLKLESEVA